MKNILITAAGGPEVLQSREAEIPSPGSNEVLIAVHFAGINRHDVGQRKRGKTPGHSDVPGLEVAGTIESVGSQVKGLKKGDRVCALTDGGGYADYAVTKAGHVLPLPEALGFEEGAGLPEALFTVWHNFYNVAQLSVGETVLIHGGTSGVGTIAIQLLTALGHRVFATCGSPDKVAAAIELGAVKAFNYKTDDFVVGVKEATEGRGVDVILDMSGGKYSVLNIEALARRGRLVHLTPGDNADFNVPIRSLMAKEAKVTGSALRPLPDEEKTLICTRLKAAAWPLVDAGKVRPLIHRVFPLEEAAAAHALMEEASYVGKILLKCGAA